MIDRRSNTHNLSSCEIKAWKKIQAWTGFEPMKLREKVITGNYVHYKIISQDGVLS